VFKPLKKFSLEDLGSTRQWWPLDKAHATRIVDDGLPSPIGLAAYLGAEHGVLEEKRKTETHTANVARTRRAHRLEFLTTPARITFATWAPAR
jgi:hypothetical protein